MGSMRCDAERKTKIRGRYQSGLKVGTNPIVTLQYISTTSYQVSDHIQWLFSLSDNRIHHYLELEEQWLCQVALSPKCTYLYLPSHSIAP